MFEADLSPDPFAEALLQQFTAQCLPLRYLEFLVQELEPDVPRFRERFLKTLVNEYPSRVSMLWADWQSACRSPSKAESMRLLAGITAVRAPQILILVAASALITDPNADLALRDVADILRLEQDIYPLACFICDAKMGFMPRDQGSKELQRLSRFAAEQTDGDRLPLAAIPQILQKAACLNDEEAETFLQDIIKLADRGILHPVLETEDEILDCLASPFDIRRGIQAAASSFCLDLAKRAASQNPMTVKRIRGTHWCLRNVWEIGALIRADFAGDARKVIREADAVASLKGCPHDLDVLSPEKLKKLILELSRRQRFSRPPSDNEPSDTGGLFSSGLYEKARPFVDIFCSYTKSSGSERKHSRRNLKEILGMHAPSVVILRALEDWFAEGGSFHEEVQLLDHQETKVLVALITDLTTSPMTAAAVSAIRRMEHEENIDA